MPLMSDELVRGITHLLKSKGGKPDAPENVKPREWEIICAGGLMLAEGWQLKKGERVKVVEVIE